MRFPTLLTRLPTLPALLLLTVALSAASCDSVTDVPDDRLEITVRQRSADGDRQVVGETRTTQPVGGLALRDVASRPVAFAAGGVAFAVDAGEPPAAPDVPVVIAYRPAFGGEEVFLVASPANPVRFDTGAGLEGTIRAFRLAGFGADAPEVILRVTSGREQTSFLVSAVLQADPGAQLRGRDLRPLDAPVTTEVAFAASDVDTPLLAVVRHAPGVYDAERLLPRTGARWAPERSAFDANAFDARLYVLQDGRRGR